jgi:hypothetical protein
MPRASSPGSRQRSFLVAVKAVAHPASVFVLILGALLVWLADRSRVNLDDTAFLASITVLVFLLPAAGIVGSKLLDEANGAVATINDQGNSPDRQLAQSTAEKTLKELLDDSRPLPRGFTYTLLAVLMSAVALVHTNETIRGVDVDRLLAAASLALLVGTAFSVFPITLRLLLLKDVQTVYESVKTDSDTTEDQADAGPLPAARPRSGLGVAALVVGVASLVAALSFVLFPLGVLGLIAVVLGAIALTPSRKRQASNSGQAFAGIVCGILALALATVFLAHFGTFATHNKDALAAFGKCIAKAGNGNAISNCITRMANEIRP